MNAVERVKSICKERKIAISKLESDCGFANGYIGQLRKGTFPDDRLRIISNYLNVTTDYIMTGKENVFVESQAEIDFALARQNERVKEYMLKFANLSDDKRNQIMSLIDMLEDK